MLPKNNSLFDKIEKKPVFMRLLSILSACFLFDKIGDNIVAKQFIIIADSGYFVNWRNTQKMTINFSKPKKPGCFPNKTKEKRKNLKMGAFLPGRAFIMAKRLRLMVTWPHRYRDETIEIIPRKPLDFLFWTRECSGICEIFSEKIRF